MTIDSLDIRQMKLFLALLEERNVTRVADKLSISQQAVSEHLRRMRRMFSDSLFHRARHGVEPTPFAEHLGVILVDTVTKLETCSSLLAGGGAGAGAGGFTHIRIGACPLAQELFFIPLLDAARQSMPDLRMTISSDLDGFSFDALRAGRMDFIIRATQPKLQISGLRVNELHTEELVWVAPSSIKRETAVAMYEQGRYTKIKVLEGEPAARRKACVSDQDEDLVTVPSYALVPDLVNTMETLAQLPKSLAASSDLQVLPHIPASDQLQLSLVTRLDTDIKVMMVSAWLSETLAAIASSINESSVGSPELASPRAAACEVKAAANL